MNFEGIRYIHKRVLFHRICLLRPTLHRVLNCYSQEDDQAYKGGILIRHFQKVQGRQIHTTTIVMVRLQIMKTIVVDIKTVGQQ